MEECNPENPKAGHCKACRKAYNARYYQAHREESLAKAREWREAHPTYHREYHYRQKAER